MKTLFGGLLLGILGTLSVQFFFPNCTIPNSDSVAQDSTQVVAVDSTQKEISPAVAVDSFPAPADSIK